MGTRTRCPAGGDETLLALPAEALEAVGDRWFEALDAAGANDRIRAFTDAIDRLGTATTTRTPALSITRWRSGWRAGRSRSSRWPTGCCPGSCSAAICRRPTTPISTPRVGPPPLAARGTAWSEEVAEELAEAADKAWVTARAHGLGSDATLGEIFAAKRITDEVVEHRTVEMLEQFDPAYAYAYLATDGVILTEHNRHLMDPAAGERGGLLCDGLRCVRRTVESRGTSSRTCGTTPDPMAPR